MRKIQSIIPLIAFVAALAMGIASLRATEVELRLIPFNQPDSTVDKLEKSRPLTNPVSTPHGLVMERVGVETVTWARNVLLDGKPVFERYVDGKYIDRIPIARADLKPGEHLIWPGDHAFAVAADGTITAKDPELIVAGNVVRIRTYPVTVRAFRANPDEGDLPMSMRVAALPNLTIRESADAASKPDGKGGKDLLPVFDKFSPLTLWLPADTVGKGYTIYPVGLTFHLTPEGIKPAAGGGETVADLRIEKSLIDIPLYAYKLSGAKGGNNRIIVPGVEQYYWASYADGELATHWYPRASPFVLQLDEVGPTIAIDGDLRKLPFKGMSVDYSDRTSGSQRLLVVETDSRHLSPGKALHARVRALDTHPVTVAYNAWKTVKDQSGKLSGELGAATAKKADAEKAQKSNDAQIEQKTKSLANPKIREDAKKRTEDDITKLKAKAADIAASITAANAEVEAMNVKLDPLKAVLADLESKLDTVKDRNPLADATVFAQVRSYDGGEWKDAALKPARAQQEFDISVPELPDGIYRLKIGIKPPDATQGELSVESWITLAGSKPYSIGLFTERSRDSFYRGEGFWIGLGIIPVKGAVAAGTPVVLEMVDRSGHRIPVFQESTAAAIDKHDTTIIRISPAACLLLAAGHYRLEARVGAISARPFPVDIVDPEPVTHFTNLFNMKYSTIGQGKDYARIIQTSEGAEQYAQWISDLGYNAVMGMNQFVDRIVRRGVEIEQLVRERPELGPWESYYQPSSRDKFMSALLRRNIRFYEDIFTYNDTMLPREPRVRDAAERYIALETTSMRHNPIFKGVALYDEFYNSGDAGTVTPVIAMHYAAQEMGYRARYEKEGYTSARALKALDRFVGRPFGQRDYKDLLIFRTWPAYEDDDWSSFSLRMSGAVKRVMPDAFNFTLRFSGGEGANVSIHGTPPSMFAGLDAAAPVMYKDGGIGDRPALSALAANTLRVNDHVAVWTQLHDANAPGLFGMHDLRQAFFALSQKVDGFSYFMLNSNPHEPVSTDHRQTFKNLIGGITNPYGDFLLSLDKGYTQVGIYYSRQADYLVSRKPNSISKSVEGIWIACMRAGYPARFIYDDQLLAGKAEKYKVIFVPGITYEDETPPEILKALQKLVDGGKTLIVEKSSKLPIERIVRANSELDEYDDKMGGVFPRYEDAEFDQVVGGSEETTALFKQLLPKYIQPATESSMLFSPDWLKKGNGEYMVMANFAPTKFTGLYKTLYQAPDMPTVRFPKRPANAVYDLLEMKPISVKTDGEWMSLEADLRDYPGKIYAFLPAAIDKVLLNATASATAGQNINFTAAVVDSKGQVINASFPVEITLTDAAGRVVYHVNRAAVPEYRGAFAIPANVNAGTWKLTVRELTSGCVSKSDIAVTSSVTVQGTADSREVWVRDAKQIAGFIADKTPATIVVDQDQAWVLPQAKRLADALTKAGKATKVARVDEVLRLPADWNRDVPVLDGSRLWRGDVVQPGLIVDGPVILLGKRLESRLIEGIARRDVLTDSISTDFPGKGRAIVAWVPLAFSNRADTIMIMAQDEVALGKGIDRLLAIAPRDDIPIRQVVSVTPDPKAALTTATSQPPAPVSYRHQATMLDPVCSVDVDPSTGRVLVGTFGYGHNLFCFDAKGTLLWKQFLPEHYVYYARWYDKGKRIVAATARGPWIFMLDPADGKVVRKFLASEWPDGHGYDGFWEGQGNTLLQIEINPAMSQIVIAGRTGLLAVDFQGTKLWFRDRADAITTYPATAEQSKAASFNDSLHVGSFAISPDGRKIVHGESLIVGSTPGKEPGTVVDLWAFRPMILDAKTGQVLAMNESDPGSTPGWSVAWPADSQNPLVRHQTGSLDAAVTNPSIVMPLLPDGKLGPLVVRANGLPLPDGKTLSLGPSSAASIDVHGNALWRIADEHLFPLALDHLSADSSKLYRCDVEGMIRCINIADGKTLWEYKAPFNGIVTPVPDSGVVVGTTNGLVIRLDPSGKPLWNEVLIDLHERPAHDYGGYIQSALRRDIDNTGELYPISHDHTGDYDTVLRMGIEQLKNGSFEALDGWTSTDGPIKTQTPGRNSDKSLVLPTGQLVTQRLVQRIIPQGTYLLEFWYKVPEEGTDVVAGAMLTAEKDKQILTASKFTGRPGEWTFGRLAVKAMIDTQTIDIGFQSENGTARIDLASFRAIRFPSSNLLANSELNPIEPTFVRDLRVQYDRIPATVREHLMSRSHVAVYKQGPGNTAAIYAQEQAFLHNGRLDDVGPVWAYPPDPMGFSAVLTKPAWISHVVLYLNNATPDNTYRFISILANNLETKVPQRVALVRGNDRRFIVVKLDKPVFTDSIKVLPGYHGGHKECLTELELYGPLGGPDSSTAGFAADDQGYPMFMGNPAHVPTTHPADLAGEYVDISKSNLPVAYFCGPTVSNQVFTFGLAAGAVGSVQIPITADEITKRMPPGPVWTLASVAPITTPAHYGSQILVGAADDQLHAVSDNGTYLWGFKAGGRVYSSPLPNGDDVYFGSDDGRLYKVDIHSGMLLWEFVTGDRVRSSPAMADGRIFFASWDGLLYCVDAESGQLIWKSPLAKYTRASPAVAGGKIYIGDESGQMLCFSAKDGALLWKQPLAGYISGCPLVTQQGALFLSEQGDAAMVAPDGSVLWRRNLGADVTGAPFATKTQVLIPTSTTVEVLHQSDGTTDHGVEGIPEGQAVGVIAYKGRLAIIRASVTTNFALPPRTYGVYNSMVELWAPADEVPARNRPAPRPRKKR